MDETIIKQGLDELARIDSDVARGLALVGYPAPRIRPAGFPTLISIIVGQQISTDAAAAILGRLKNHMKDESAESYLALSEDDMRVIGFSRRKHEYATGVARTIIDGSLDIDALNDMDDETVIKELTALKGLGRWSAEIYAMFSLSRRDIFPADDIALQEALRRLKGHEDRPTGKQARALIEHWSPWRSVGSLFLWRYYRGAPE
jgi:DNA-3-methyladenine glycosylase II